MLFLSKPRPKFYGHRSPDYRLPLTPTVISTAENIHRRRTAVHLPAKGASLLAMANGDSRTVIYIIIAKQMKTVYTFSTVQSISDIKSNIRLTLAVVGVMTALICSLILFNENDSMHAFSQLPRITGTSKTIAVSIDLKNADVVSAMRTVKW